MQSGPSSDHLVRPASRDLPPVALAPAGLRTSAPGTGTEWVLPSTGLPSPREWAAPGVLAENAVVAALAWIAWLLPRALGYPQLDLALFSLATPFAFAVLLRRGALVLPGLLLGLLAAAPLWSSWPQSVASAFGIVLGAWAAWAALVTFYRHRPRGSVVLLMARMLLVALLVQAPLTGLLSYPAVEAVSSRLGVPALRSLAGTVLIHAMSSTIYASAFMLLLPMRPGQLPVARLPDAWRSIEWSSVVAVGAITAICMVALHTFSMGPVQSIGLITTIALPILLLAALHGGARTAATLLALAATTLFVVWPRLEPDPLDAASQQRLTQLLLWTAQGAALYQLLLATSLERRRQALRVRRRTITDAATGLANEQGLAEALAGLAATPPPGGFVAVQVDVEGHDAIVALTGRSGARQISRMLGERIAAAAAGLQVECLAALAEDRFTLVARPRQGEVDAAGTEALAEALHRALDGTPVEAGTHRLLVRVTAVAVTVGPGDTFTLETLLDALSLLQQRALASAGRRASAPLASLADQDSRGAFERIETVKEALQARRFVLHAQPIIAARRGASPGGPLHYEVLARMRDADGNLLPPAAFLPAITQGRLQREFDHQVLSLALDTLVTDDALCRATSLCAINVTGPTLSDAAFADFVEAELRRTGLPPGILGLEVTEGESIGCFEVARENIERLSRLGVQVAIDDFGTGLATFDYVKRFPADTLKIDGSFVRRLGDDLVDREIVQSIVRVAHAMGAQTVAECVETMALARQLEGYGVDHLQGYGIARPMPIGELHAWFLASSGSPAAQVQAQEE